MEIAPINQLNSNEVLLKIKTLDSCRICLDSGSTPLLSPCNCLGSSKFVHESCLKQWISMKYFKVSEAKCEICLFKFSMNVTELRKCDPKNGILRKHSYFRCIPILLILIVSTIIFIPVYIENCFDLHKNQVSSIIVLSVTLFILLIEISLLLKTLCRAFIVIKIKEWKILPVNENFLSDAQ